MNKPILAALVFVVMALALSLPNVTHAQTVTPTFTPGPTSTPFATPTLRPDRISAATVIDPGDAPIIGRDSFIRILAWGWNVKTRIDYMNRMLTTTFDDTALRIHAYSPMPFLRGAAILFSDFDWLMKIIGWFIFAAIVIVLVSVVRFIISAWGIVQRLLDVIKAIPFI
jgi:hypothetical protein